MVSGSMPVNGSSSSRVSLSARVPAAGPHGVSARRTAFVPGARGRLHPIQSVKSRCRSALCISFFLREHQFHVLDGVQLGAEPVFLKDAPTFPTPVTVPEVGTSSPMRMRSRVVLPHPLGAQRMTGPVTVRSSASKSVFLRSVLSGSKFPVCIAFYTLSSPSTRATALSSRPGTAFRTPRSAG